MKKYLILPFAFVCLTATSEMESKPYDYKVIKVIDGDTVAFQADFLPEPLPPILKIRVYGVDTPEKAPRAKCESEAARGQAATDFTKHAVANAHKVQIVISNKWDKYGGRVLGDVLLDGQSLRDQLIAQGYAREYNGEAKKSWCN